MNTPLTFRHFFPSDLQALSLFRILLGLLLLVDVFQNTLPYMGDFFYDSGYTPRAVIAPLERTAGRLSLLDMSGHPWVVNTIMAVYVFAVLAFIFGFRTGIAKWAVFIGYLSIVHRVPLIGTGAEMLIRLFLLWMLFLPIARYWSVDAALSRQPRKVDVPPVFMAGIKLQITWLYLFAAIYKVIGTPWLTGDAVAFTLHDRIFASNLGLLFVQNFPFLVAPLNYGVIVFQFLFTPMVYAPLGGGVLRALAILGAVAMHLGFLVLLEIGIFPFICIIYLVLLVPDAWWDKIFAKRRTDREKIKIYFNPDKGGCEKTARIAREFCLSPNSTVAAHDGEGFVVVDDKTGKSFAGGAAFAFLLTQSLLFWPLGFLCQLPIVSGFLEKTTALILKHAPAHDKKAQGLFPWYDKHYRPTAFAKALCGFFIFLAFISNVMFLPLPPSAALRKVVPLRTLVSLSQTYQQWNLFAPVPVRMVYDFSIEGETASGKTVDISPLFERNRITRGENGHLKFTTHHWGKFFFNFYNGRYRSVMTRVMTRLCARFNAKPENKDDPLINATLTFSHVTFDLAEDGFAPKEKQSATVSCDAKIDDGLY